MKNFLKKTAAGLLALLIVAGAVPDKLFAELSERAEITASATDEIITGSCGDDATWALDPSTGTLSISGTGEVTSDTWSDFIIEITHVIIEDGITSIFSRAFLQYWNLKTVEIGSTVESIGDSAFVHCRKMESVEIGSKVESIGVAAFSFCVLLGSVEIPDSVTSIGTDAFSQCWSLESVKNWQRC